MGKRPYLEDSLVILTGDHSFPAGEHGNYHNERGFYDELFRVPFLMLWKNRLEPRTIEVVAYSQVDIAPTILDALEIEPPGHMIGRSLLDTTSARQAPIHLIQPYDGRYLGTVLFPMKYMIHERCGTEWLFNVQDDPHEQVNLIDDRASKAVLNELRRETKWIYANQRMLEANGR